ncbi:hypothetical protein NGH32_07080 [Staphylococcus xylosus]|uniref:hypothetical protein n=1 Tax=Staphylococcus xylosus TaxID=1288 RepID=UPI001C1DCF00|nr:hypothetical protein [Staphylococcus xylosus]MBU6132142.1 hypothetical protein [Staphylococcus xylosus]MEB8150463.1 hypothetical protein [Staphylococcus xylosus]
MSKEIPIVRFEFGGEDAFAQTHINGVIGLEDMIEEYNKKDIVLRANNGALFKLVVNETGELSTERIEGDNV